MLKHMDADEVPAGEGDEGVALIAAILAIVISMLLVAALMSVGVNGVTTGAQSRMSQQNVDAAASGMLAVQSEITTYVKANLVLPSQGQLTWALTLPAVGGLSDPASIVVPGSTTDTNPNDIPQASQLVYYSANPPTAASAIGTTPTSSAQSALLTVVATTGSAAALTNQSQQELLTVSAGNSSTTLSDAVYGSSGISFTNGTVSINGPNPELYSNDSTDPSLLPCGGTGGSSGIKITGSLVVPNTPNPSQTWSVTAQCDVTGNLYTAWPLALSSANWYVTGTIFGTQGIAVNSGSNGPSSGNVDAGGAVTGTPGCASFVICTQNDDPKVQTTVSSMVQAFPQLTWNGSAPGWGIVTATTCTQALADMGTYSNDPAAGSQGWVIYIPAGDCPTLTFDKTGGSSANGYNGTGFAMGNNLTIVTTGAITFGNSNGQQITDSPPTATYSLDYIVPYSTNGAQTVCPTGSSGAGDITVKNDPSWNGPNVMFYTPCAFTTESSQFGVTGAIYVGGMATFPGNTTITETPMIAPLQTTSAPVATAVVQWERQSS